MKKLLAMLLVLAMVFSMAACTQQPNEPQGEDETNEYNAEDYISDAFIDPVTEWAQFDELVAQIKSETDFAKRAELMHQAEDILMSNY